MPMDHDFSRRTSATQRNTENLLEQASQHVEKFVGGREVYSMDGDGRERRDLYPDLSLHGNGAEEIKWLV